MMSVVIELMVLSILSICWLSAHGRLTHALTSDVYHVADEKRNARKARFYFQSVWVGVAAAFFCARTLEALSSLTFDSSSQRNWVMGSLRGAEMWGLLIIGAVWSLVGKRVSRPNSDGKSLVPERISSTNREAGTGFSDRNHR